MAPSMSPKGEKEKKEGRISIWMVFAIISFVLLVAGLVYWGSVTRRSLAPAFTESAINYTMQDPLPSTQVANATELGDGPKLVFAKRTVTGIDAQGNNIYTTALFQSDRSGERMFPFYETNDITFEQIEPYNGIGFVVFSPLLGTKPTVIGRDGTTLSDTFVPPGIGNLYSYVFSPDGRYLAYLDFSDQPAADASATFVPESTVVVRNMTTGEETRLSSTLFAHGGTQYSRLSLRALSDDGATLYLTAVWPGQNFGDPESFFAVQWKEASVRELSYSSLEEQGADQVLEFVGAYPAHGFALFNRGPLLPDNSGGLADRVRLERLDIATGVMTTVYEAESGSISNVLYDPLSPDGTRIVIDNDVVQGGFRIVDISTNEIFPAVTAGTFLGWAGDRDHVVYEIRQDAPDAQDKYIALKSLSLDTGNITEIYHQTVLQEGTGLNSAGDILYSYIGNIQ